MADQLDGKKPGLAEGIERFNELPKNAKLGILGLFVFFFLVFLMRGGGDAPAPAPENLAQQPEQSQVFASADQAEEDEEGFNPVGPDRASLRRGFVTQQTQALQQMRTEIQKESEQQRQEFLQRNQEMQQLQIQLQETLRVMSEQMQSMEQSNVRQRDEITRLVEEARRQGLRSVGNQQNNNEPIRRRTQGRITETRLGGAGGPNVGNDQALLQGVLKTTTGQTAGINNQDDLLAEEEPLPFIPPLGFIKATLLNGVDALATSGLATPALARLHGVYKTAMNSTVFLDGCFMLLEFEGDISTERARGRPSRMTCVYPDRGAVTYDIAGYVVDAEDGLEGVPGIFYEGDSGRIALAIAAQFAAGIANIIANNQNTNVTSAEGNNQQFLTGSETRGAIAGGVASATNRLTDFLLERAERVAPFIRIDALRKVHVVLLSGTELRTQGSAWSLLFNAEDDLL